MKTSKAQILSEQIQDWYLTHKRELAWRKNKDPYRIWISEIMLQQTTVQAVIPYYDRFMKRFPRVEDLAQAPLEDVLSLWSGLGYYSRARNLHKASQVLAKNSFPRNYLALLEIPGLGPYTARAIASLAFDEPVGVLDGNVIRILCRVYGLKSLWWKTLERHKLQTLADELAQFGSSSHINQALMELGALICSPQSPACNLCPWQRQCVAYKNDLLDQLPLKKPRKAAEIWYWRPTLLLNNQQIALVENTKIPFLKKSYLPPGEAKKLEKPPQKFDFLHTITHHKIYVKAGVKKTPNKGPYRWVALEKIAEVNPSSLLQKTLKFARD